MVIVFSDLWDGELWRTGDRYLSYGLCQPKIWILSADAFVLYSGAGQDDMYVFSDISYETGCSETYGKRSERTAYQRDDPCSAIQYDPCISILCFRRKILPGIWILGNYPVCDSFTDH